MQSPVTAVGPALVWLAIGTTAASRAPSHPRLRRAEHAWAAGRGSRACGSKVGKKKTAAARRIRVTAFCFRNTLHAMVIVVYTMSDAYNIYCDESCHLEHDGQKAMVLGALWCPSTTVRECNVAIRDIKALYGLNKQFEIKWTKVSPAKLDFYRALIDYFFKNQNLHFRALIVPDKTKLDHEAHHQTHDDWYYKMYFDMLKVILNPSATYQIFLDIKDTRSARKVVKLQEVLRNNMYDFSRSIVQNVQNVHSHEIELLQLCDLLIGAVSYVNRGLTGSSAKQQLVQRMRECSGYKLTWTTLLKEEKVNLFRWRAGDGEA
jgi:hypothetical protein